MEFKPQTDVAVLVSLKVVSQNLVLNEYYHVEMHSNILH